LSEWVFSYGTLRLPEVQLANYGRLLEGVADRLPEFHLERLVITNPEVVAVSGIAEHPVAVHTGDRADQVDGTRFALSRAELVATDTYEVRRLPAGAGSAGLRHQSLALRRQALLVDQRQCPVAAAAAPCSPRATVASRPPV
jgi:hypothetical protein